MSSSEIVPAMNRPEGGEWECECVGQIVDHGKAACGANGPMLEGQDCDDGFGVDVFEKGLVESELGKAFGKLSEGQLGFNDHNSIPLFHDGVRSTMMD